MVHYLVRKYCAVLTSVDSNDILCSTDISRQYILYVVRKYCTVQTSVDSNDILYRYCIVHYSRTYNVHYANTVQFITYLLRKYCYVNTVQYIIYYVNTVQYITVVHYFIITLILCSTLKYCTVHIT